MTHIESQEKQMDLEISTQVQGYSLEAKNLKDLLILYMITVSYHFWANLTVFPLCGCKH